jgi:hypothetical protein
MTYPPNQAASHLAQLSRIARSNGVQQAAAHGVHALDE